MSQTPEFVISLEDCKKLSKNERNPIIYMGELGHLSARIAGGHWVIVIEDISTIGRQKNIVEATGDLVVTANRIAQKDAEEKIHSITVCSESPDGRWERTFVHGFVFNEF